MPGAGCPRFSFPFRRRKRQEKTLEEQMMIEVYPHLHIGSWIDYEKVVSGESGWAVVHACKEYDRITVAISYGTYPGIIQNTCLRAEKTE